MKNAITLIDDLIILAKEEDRIHKQNSHLNKKSSQTVGNSAMVHHLQTLRELIVEDELIKFKNINNQLTTNLDKIDDGFSITVKDLKGALERVSEPSKDTCCGGSCGNRCGGH